MQSNPPDRSSLTEYINHVKQKLNNLYERHPELSTLSRRELEVFSVLLTDKSLADIASELFITYSAIHFHCKNIYRKLGLSGRRQLLIKYKDV